jgi:hypothetical protein
MHPYGKHTGQTPDILKFLRFCWWEHFYFLDMDGVECLGQWAGVAEHVGDKFTYMAVSETTHQAMYQSDICTTTDPNSPNYRAEVIYGMNLKHTAKQDEGSTLIFPTFGQGYIVPFIEKVYPLMPSKLIGKTIMREEKDGNIF